MASSRKSALGDDRPTNYPNPLPAHVIVPNVRVKISEKPEFPGIADLWAVKALVWTTKPTGSPTPESRKSTQPKRVPAACLFYTEMGVQLPKVEKVPSRRGYPRHACSIRKCAFSGIFVPLFLGNQSFPGIAVHVV